MLGDSQFGPVIFDAGGQAIYLFEPESDGVPQCYGDCAVAWPPVLTTGAPGVGAGLDGAALGVVERDDGGTQVTYNGWPLYYYAHEGKNVVECHNIVSYGALWFALDAAGDAAPY